MMQKTQTKTLQLLSRFALPPNSLGYCGKDSAVEKLKKCITSGVCDAVEKEISKFIVLYPYLKTISEISNRDVFDYKVVECFWLGNDLVKRAKPKHYDLLIKNFSSQGVLESVIEDLRINTPKVFLPFHLFQVLHIGVGKCSGSVPFNMDSVNNCMIRWGEVEKITKSHVLVNLYSLTVKKGCYHIIKKREKFSFDPEIIKGVKLGDMVSVHWRVPNKILEEEEIKNLEHWSCKTVEFINSGN
ncbi:hypothetical protein JXA34_04030 [Patescibacteria group bacterium]|nr:hypothetical protein [Patescibacteria group bacterium]